VNETRIVRSDIPGDHAIVEAVPDDDRAVMKRLAALEAEVKADTDAQQARKAAALARLREQRVTQAAERARTAEPARKPRASARDDREDLEGLGGALELASRANQVKHELARKPRKGEKSWIVSGVASLALGPAGWLYAGSLREAVPAGVAWAAFWAFAWNYLPFFVLPILMVVGPLSAIAGVVYALQYNRSGRRQRLFSGDKAKAKQLPGE
jgi:hypothetical protein